MRQQIYELSFWLRQDVENLDLKKLFDKYKFEIIREIAPRTLKPAYPINKETVAKFITIYFKGDPQNIENFKSNLRNLKEILRFVILKRKVLKEVNAALK